MTELTTIDALRANDKLNQTLCQFITEGLSDIGGTPKVSIALIEGHAAKTSMHALHLMLAHGSIKQPRKKKLGVADDDDVEAFRRYVSHVAKSHNRVIKKAGPALVGSNMTGEAMNAIVAEAGFQAQPELPFDPYKGDPVQSAWWMAIKNRHQSIQRLGALMYMRSQAWPHLYGVEKETLDKNFHEAANHLSGDMMTFQENELKFAVLLDGEALAHTKKRIVDDSFGPNMSIIQYITNGGIIPGSYNGATEDALRASINHYANL